VLVSTHNNSDILRQFLFADSTPLTPDLLEILEVPYLMGGKNSKIYHMKVADDAMVPISDSCTDKANVEGDLDDHHHPPPGKLTRKKSSAGLGGSSANLLNQKSMRSLRSNSLRMGGRQQSMVSGMISPSSLQVSSKAPWLVKKMPAQTVHDTEFKFGRVIGKGLMGTVHIASFQSDNKPHYVAIKSVRKDYIIRHHDERHIRNEKEILLSLNSPFCVKLFGTFQDSDNIHFVMEYCAGGELFRKLTKKRSFQPNMVKFYASEIFLALYHIHDLGFVFRDLKPENVMLDEMGHCKLIDFGFATRPNEQGLCLTNVGTPAYLSPEQLNGKFTHGYTKIVDWWSFGILVYELLTGNTPFCRSFSESSYEIYLRVLKGHIKFPWGFSSTAKEFITELLCADVSQRLVDPELIKRHKYFQGVNWEWIERKKIVPPSIPKLYEEGDTLHFDSYGEGDSKNRPVKLKKGQTFVDTFQDI
jgi:tRNA A-37 threonylcarbamoyl transferase component Bud32